MRSFFYRIFYQHVQATRAHNLLLKAEAYHQKWLLQRRPAWLQALDLPDARALVDSPAAARLNACAAGRIPAADVIASVEQWVVDGSISQHAG